MTYAPDTSPPDVQPTPPDTHYTTPRRDADAYAPQRPSHTAEPLDAPSATPPVGVGATDTEGGCIVVGHRVVTLPNGDHSVQHRQIGGELVRHLADVVRAERLGEVGRRHAPIQQQPTGEVNNKPRAHDLFCGSGGASLGLHRAGLDVTGYDHWQPAVDTHNANGLPAHLLDLAATDPSGPAPDVVWASPPCQPFSAAGDGAGVDDDRDGFPWLLRILTNYQPRPGLVMIENVKGLTFDTHRDYFSSVLNSLHRLGYQVDWRVLNAADFGVPQVRERCIIIARCDGHPIAWPMPTHTEQPGMFTDQWVTMASALGWSSGVEYQYRRGAGITERDGPRGPWQASDGPAPTVHRNTAKDLLMTCHKCKGSGADFSIEYDRPPFFNCCPDCGGLRDRVPTTPELAALQGFPPDWTWTGNKTAQARQIGNAVPAALAHAIAAANLRAVRSAA